MKQWMQWFAMGAIVAVMSGCGSGGGGGEQAFVPNIAKEEFKDTKVYRANSPYKRVLQECIGIADKNDSCLLSTLPLLAQENPIPTKEQIMNRVVVSHDWMGERFEQLLDVLDDDIKILLGATTAIVIDSDIIPSYYSAMTGAIYLDPKGLWLTPEEAKTLYIEISNPDGNGTISVIEEDYRVDFGEKLKFLDIWRYVKNNDYAIKYYPIDQNLTRGVEDIKYSMARLFYHELSHANDFNPPSLITSLENNLSVWDNALKNYPDWISVQLNEVSPLKSEIMRHLANVLNDGEEPTLEATLMTSEEVGTHFGGEGAEDLYGYRYTRLEDSAMLFEATMMKYHYGIEKDTMFTANPSDDETVVCADYTIGWGERNRIANPLVKPRAMFVAQMFLPVHDWSTFFDYDVGAVISLADKDYCSSLGKSQKALKGSEIKEYYLRQKADRRQDIMSDIIHDINPRN